MSAPEHILLKIKLLLNLATSSNPNEADNAKSMADKLIAKYEITPEELKKLEDKKPLYGENERLYSTTGLVSWRQQLALAICKHFECQIVQEELVPVEGFHQFNYYVYGDSQDAENVKYVLKIFFERIEELINDKCIGRGPVYVSSYGEGVVESVKNNIYWDGIELPNKKAPSREREAKKEKPVEGGTMNLSTTPTEKEKPADKTIDINSQTLIKDVMAFFKGMEDGRHLSLEEMMELAEENERVKEFQTDQEAGRVQEESKEPPTKEKV